MGLVLTHDMESNARIGKHPIHPATVVLPIALYTMTVGALVAAVGSEDAFWYHFALVTDLVGVATALIASLPGAIDLVTLKLRPAVRTIGIGHAALNVSATLMFAISGLLLYRGWTHRESFELEAAIPLAVAVVGFVAMVSAVMLGYALVHEYGVGVTRPTVRLPDPDSYDDSFTGLAYQTPAKNPHSTQRNRIIHNTTIH